MTDTERHSLSERIATLADAAGLPSELVWEEASGCDQGHEQLPRMTGQPCWICGEVLPRVSRDFTDPAYLLPLVKAWIEQQPDDEGWTYQVAWCVGQAVGNLYEVVDQDWGRHYDGDDAESEWVALALALAEALEKGVAE